MTTFSKHKENNFMDDIEGEDPTIRMLNATIKLIETAPSHNSLKKLLEEDGVFHKVFEQIEDSIHFDKIRKLLYRFVRVRFFELMD